MAYDRVRGLRYQKSLKMHQQPGWDCRLSCSHLLLVEIVESGSELYRMYVSFSTTISQ